MALHELPFGEMIASALGGGGLAKAADLLMNRRKQRVEALDLAVQSVSAQLQRTDERLEKVEAQHEQCEENLRAANVRIDEAHAEIRRLMAGAPADYSPSDLRRVPPKGDQ